MAMNPLFGNYEQAMTESGRLAMNPLNALFAGMEQNTREKQQAQALESMKLANILDQQKQQENQYKLADMAFLNRDDRRQSDLDAQMAKNTGTIYDTANKVATSGSTIASTNAGNETEAAAKGLLGNFYKTNQYIDAIRRGDPSSLPDQVKGILGNFGPEKTITLLDDQNKQLANSMSLDPATLSKLAIEAMRGGLDIAKAAKSGEYSVQAAKAGATGVENAAARTVLGSETTLLNNINTRLATLSEKMTAELNQIMTLNETVRKEKDPVKKQQLALEVLKKTDMWGEAQSLKTQRDSLAKSRAGTVSHLQERAGMDSDTPTPPAATATPSSNTVRVTDADLAAFRNQR